jgi:hypothetical protein
MENRPPDIPFYKIYHIRSANEDAKSAEDVAALTPEYNVLYVFYGNVEFNTDDGRIVNINDIFVQEPANPYFQHIFSEFELNVIHENNMNVVFLAERIYPDDSIETIKKKFLYLTREKLGLSYGELYLFCKKPKRITTQLAHDQITSSGKLEMTPVRVHNYLSNIDNHTKDADTDSPISLGAPVGGNYTYTNIANLKLEENVRIINIAMGQELNIASSHEYPYSINPFDAMNADPFLEIHAGEIVNTTNKVVLIDYGMFIDNTIYLVTAEDVLVYARDFARDAPLAEGEGAARIGKPIYESYMVSLYFPYLAAYQDNTPRTVVERGSAEAAGETDLATIHSHNTLMLHKPALFEADKKILNERFMRQTANIKLLYDIYERRTTEHNYLDDGIRGVEFMIHPETSYNQSLDAVFKLIHCSDSIPYIKHNPGKKRDNIYKLFISGVSRSGRKIPYLPKADIFRLIKTTARKKSVAIYINYIYSNPEIPDHKATHLPIPVLCEFYPDGGIYVKLFVKFSFTTKEIEDIIMATVNPVLRVIKEQVEQGGFQMHLFTKLHHPQIELINVEYFAQLPITRNIEIKQMIKCISSAFNEVEGSLKKGIVLRYKRVSNYNDMSSQDAYIIEMMNKRQSDRDIIDGLKDNYMMSDQDARGKLSAMLSSLQTQQFSRFRGGNIRIKNNPGFLTKITKGAFNNIITIEITNINNILFLTPLHAYLDSIIRIYQNPSTTNIPYEKIAELCSNKAFVDTRPAILSTATATAATAAAASASSAPSSVIDSFMSNSMPEAVGNIEPSDKEESIELMAEIVPVIKRPPPTSAAVAAASAAAPVFGFEVEDAGLEKEDEEPDLFALLQGDDDDEYDEGDAAPSSEQGGGGGGGGGAAAARPGAAASHKEPPQSSGHDEDLSDITGMELANPNPFSKRIQERDPVIHLNEDVGKFNAYSRSCPWNVRRQPVILTNEEKGRIDKEHPGSYSHSISYGSDASKQYHYICPRYWSLKHNTSLTEEEVKSGKYGAIIPQKAKKIPPGANIFEFTDDKYHVDEKGNYKQHYPGFLKKDAHPKGLCVPCCFAQWDKPSQTARRQECEAKKFESVQMTSKPTPRSAAAGAADATPLAQESTPRPVATFAAIEPEPVKLTEMKDDRILSSDKFPLENNRIGYLPTQLQKFLFTDNRNCQVSLKNASIKKDTPCLIRRGVETNDRQSFVSAIAYYYKESMGVEKTSATVANPPPAAAVQPSSMTVRQSAVLPKSDDAAASAGLDLPPMTSKNVKDQILKNVTDKIQKGAMNMMKLAAADSGYASAGAGAAVDFSPRPNGAAAAAAAAVDQGNYSDDDDTSVVMTPRAAAAAAVAATTPRPLMRGAPAVTAGDYIPNIREMRELIINSLDIDMFITLQNGTLVDSFYNPNKELLETDLARKYAHSAISQTLPKPTFARICNAYENFVAYLADDTSIIDHTYLWDIVSRPNERLFKHGNNIILLHIPDDDITNNVQVICPTNAYSGEVFDINRKTIIIMKRDTYYEPIYLFESKSNGKFSVIGRFALKSKTLMPKIKHIIETVRDVYFSYCRLHASQPREYKYKMNQPAAIVAKTLRDAGFQIEAQVMNFNGKVIGLQIAQTIARTIRSSVLQEKQYSRKLLRGVIPTAVSAPLSGGGGNASASPPMIIMNDDSLWQMSYHETVEFLKEVHAHVKKTTKRDIFCNPKVKVVEDGLIVGVITETNQFIQVNVENDPQLNQNDDLPTITENNHLIADEVVANTPTTERPDKARERYVRNIRLETNFYNVFRNTARNILNRPENKAVKDDIEKIVASPFVIYTNKLSQIIAHMKRILSKHVSFIRYKKDTLKMVGEISGCVASDAETCGKKSYCMREFGGLCKLLLPNRNLMFPDIDNEDAYFGKIADEMIRYERVRLFMFEPMKYLSFQDIKYNLRENEIILLETFITQEYFENMEPADANPYIHQTNFYTVLPSTAGSHGVQHYDPVYRKEYTDKYLSIEAGAGAGAVAAAAGAGEPMKMGISQHIPESFHLNEINHVLDFCQQVSKRKVTVKLRNTFFPKANTYEIIFSNESKECSFDIILTILRIVAQNASKCPSGHGCVRTGSGVGGVFSQEKDPEICQKCRTNIGVGQPEFACRECNYFICDNCRIQHVDEIAGITIPRIKEILATEYAKLAERGLDKKLIMIMNGYGMKQYADIINEGRATLSQIIQSENYFLTNFDVWMLSLYFKIPIVFVSQTLLSENGKNYMVLYGDEMTDSYFFIQPFQITQDVPSRFGLIEIKADDETSILKIPLEFVSPQLQDSIRTGEGGEGGAARISLEEYVQTFKLGNIKHKKRVFTAMKDAKEPALMPEEE